MNEKLKKTFAKKWKMDEDVVFTIFRMIQDAGAKYGKVSRTLKGFSIQLSSRQLRYFYRKVKMYNKYDIIKKGKPKNYSELLRRKT